MGPASFDPMDIPVSAPAPFDLEFTIDGVHYTGDAAGMGNPHVVILASDVDAFPLERIGPVIEHDHRFPRRTNVEVIAVAGDGLALRVWERGVGITRSCGTGVCAAAAVAHRRGLVAAAMVVTVPGGQLDVVVGDVIRLSGPVAHVFDVDVDLDHIRPDQIRHRAGWMGVQQ
jgi:diaminopimelate epimerase